MARFVGRRKDLTWGPYNYPVTRTQKEALDGLWYMMSGLPQSRSINGYIPEGYFCSQRPDTGEVIMGLHHHSVSIHRNGRITSNEQISVHYPFPSRTAS
jgi:hypothetical protein